MSLKLLGLLAMSVLLTGNARAGDIWLSGLDPISRQIKEPGAPSDFMELFRPGAPWSVAASKVKVLKLSSEFVLHGSDDDLRTTFAGLKVRNIALGLETGVLFGDHCGKGMEGFSYPTTATTIGQRIQRLGGDLAYVAMDEQLWFGHFDNSEQACHFSIPEIARQVALHSAELKAIFPSVHIGAIEPITDELPTTALRQYLDAYRSASRSAFAFLHTDIQWAKRWEQPLIEAAALARAEKIPFGTIIDSDQPQERSDSTWTARASNRLAAVRSVISPDHIIVQSWIAAPSRWLPETDASTLTSVVKDMP
jgi:hypothetical protein